MKKTRLYLLLSLDLLTAIGVVVGLLMMLPSFGVNVFIYYTVNSNILGAVACLTEAAFIVRGLLSGKPVPYGATLFKLAAVGCLLLTFAVVVAVLAPSYDNYLFMFEDEMLFHHLLCPLLAFFSFILFPHKKPLGRLAPLVGLIPTLLYGVPAITLNILRVWHGPYPFLLVYEQPVWASVLWVLVIFGVDFLLLFGTKVLYNRILKNHTIKEKLP